MTLLQELRRSERVIVRLRNELRAFLDEEEACGLSNLWPYGDHPPGKPRLCRILAREFVRAGREDDLRRIKAARRVLGLPAWWNLP